MHLHATHANTHLRKEREIWQSSKMFNCKRTRQLPCHIHLCVCVCNHLLLSVYNDGNWHINLIKHEYNKCRPITECDRQQTVQYKQAQCQVIHMHFIIISVFMAYSVVYGIHFVLFCWSDLCLMFCLMFICFLHNASSTIRRWRFVWLCLCFSIETESC